MFILYPKKSSENNIFLEFNFNNIFFPTFFFDAPFKFRPFCVPGYHVQEVEGTQNGGRPQDSHLEKSEENKSSSKFYFKKLFF